MAYAFNGMIIFTFVYILIPGKSKYLMIALNNMVALAASIVLQKLNAKNIKAKVVVTE